MALWRSEEGGSGSRAVEEIRSAAIWQSSANQPCSIWSGCRRVARSRHDVQATGGARVKTPVRTAVPSPLVHVERRLLVEQTIVPRYRTSSMSQRARAISSRRMSSTESSAASSAGRGRERSKGASCSMRWSWSAATANPPLQPHRPHRGVQDVSIACLECLAVAGLAPLARRRSVTAATTLSPRR